MTVAVTRPGILVLGIGNILHGDDGIGIHIIEAMRKRAVVGASVKLRDGGTIGLTLLPEIEDSGAFPQVVNT